MLKCMKWLLILAVMTASQIGLHGAGKDVEMCRLFLSVMAANVEDIQGHPGYFETIDICRKLLEPVWNGKRLLKPSKKLISNDLIRQEQSASQALRGTKDQSFRRNRNDDIKHHQNCSIDFFPSLEFRHGESKITLTGSVSKIKLYEKSLRTHGDCCWVIFNSKKFRGNRRRIYGAKNFNSFEEWDMRAGEIRSVLIRPKCKFPPG